MYSYDYEEVDSESANKVMKQLEEKFAQQTFVGESLKATSSDTSFSVKEASNFSYTDPIDNSVSKNQGLYVRFSDGSRIVFRLSGTGSSGATIRLYVEKYSKDTKEYERDTQEGLKPLIEVALELSQLVQITGRKEPTVITVCLSFLTSTRHRGCEVDVLAYSKRMGDDKLSHHICYFFLLFFFISPSSLLCQSVPIKSLCVLQLFQSREATCRSERERKSEKRLYFESSDSLLLLPCFWRLDSRSCDRPRQRRPA